MLPVGNQDGDSMKQKTDVLFEVKAEDLL